MTKYFCDKCKTETPKPYRIEIKFNQGEGTNFYWDFCLDCFNKVREVVIERGSDSLESIKKTVLEQI